MSIIAFHWHVSGIFMHPGSRALNPPLVRASIIQFSGWSAPLNNKSFIALHSILKLYHSADWNLEIFWTVENQKDMILCNG